MCQSQTGTNKSSSLPLSESSVRKRKAAVGITSPRPEELVVSNLSEVDGPKLTVAIPIPTRQIKSSRQPSSRVVCLLRGLWSWANSVARIVEI